MRGDQLRLRVARGKVQPIATRTGPGAGHRVALRPARGGAFARRIGLTPLRGIGACRIVCQLSHVSRSPCRQTHMHTRHRQHALDQFAGHQCGVAGRRNRARRHSISGFASYRRHSSTIESHISHRLTAAGSSTTNTEHAEKAIAGFSRSRREPVTHGSASPYRGRS